MTDEEIKLECLRLAEARAARSGVTNFCVENMAREYIEIVFGLKYGSLAAPYPTIARFEDIDDLKDLIKVEPGGCIKVPCS